VTVSAPLGVLECRPKWIGRLSGWPVRIGCQDAFRGGQVEALRSQGCRGATSRGSRSPVQAGGQGNCCLKAPKLESPRVDALACQCPCDRSVRTRDSGASRTEHPLSSWEQAENRVCQPTFGWNEAETCVAPRDDDIDRFRPSASAESELRKTRAPQGAPRDLASSVLGPA